jgi:hypothetical protein
MPLTDFFLASMQELRAACPGWKDPLPQPVKRQSVNPFTRQPMEFMSCAPDEAEPFDPGAAERANLTGLHRVDLKGLGTAEMEELVRVVLEGPEQHAANVYDTPLYGPPGDSDEVIFRMPTALIDRLARMDDTAVADYLERWNEAVGHDLSEYLAALTELARKGVAENRQVFMWICP